MPDYRCVWQENVTYTGWIAAASPEAALERWKNEGLEAVTGEKSIDNDVFTDSIEIDEED